VSDPKRFHLTLLNVAVARFQPHGSGNGKQLGIQSFFSENTATARSQPYSLVARSESSVQMEVGAWYPTARCEESLPVPTVSQASTLQPSSKRNQKGNTIATTVANERKRSASSSSSSRSSEALKGPLPDSREQVVVTAKDIDDLFDL